MSPSLSRTTRSGFTAATSSATGADSSNESFESSSLRHTQFDLRNTRFRAEEIAQSLFYETNAASDLRCHFDEPLCSSVQQAPAYIRICSSTGSSSDGHARAEQSATAFRGSASFDLGY